jgi:Tfp pilus assembly PilM family ATPase
VTYADELVRELAVSFAYAAHEYPDGEVGRLLMVGGGGAMPGLAGRLTDALGVAAAPVTPAEVFGCGPGLLAACGSPALTAAAGLALFPEGR